MGREATGLVLNKAQGFRGVVGVGEELLESVAADKLAGHSDVGSESLARA